MVENTLILTYKSELAQVRNIIVQILDYIRFKNPSITDEDMFDLKLVYSELIINAIKHGNKNDINKTVTIEIDINDTMIFSRITDEGNGFNYNESLNKSKSDDAIFENNGRGIRLVNSLTDIVSVNSSGNQIKFSKKVEPHV